MPMPPHGGEKWAGAGKEADSLVMLTLGTGIGGGIVINNTLWRGINNVAAEIGHMVIQMNGGKVQLRQQRMYRGLRFSYGDGSAV